MTAPLDRLLAALEAADCRPKREGNGWRARCPSRLHEHGNRKSPALHLEEAEDGRVLLTCHASCQLEDILDPLGIEPAELFPGHERPRRHAPARAPRPAPKRRETADLGALRVPSGTTAPTPGLLALPDLGEPTQIWPYRAPDRWPLRLVVARYRLADGSKSIRPFKLEGDRWTPGTVPAPRPLYGLERLAASPDARVLILEGEKSCDAAGKLFKDHACITSPGGSSAAAKADWSPLAGRSVSIWPDADAAGLRYAQAVAELAREAGAADVRIVKVPTSFPSGWDLADSPPEGWTTGRLLELLEGAPAVEAPSAHADDWPEPVPLDSAGDLPRLRPEVIPSWAGDFVQALAAATETPPELAAGLALAACSTAAARRCEIEVRRGYREPLNLWLAVALPPGARKSSVQGAATAPLTAWRRDEALRMAPEINAAASRRKPLESQAKSLRSRGATAKDSATFEDFARQTAAIEGGLPAVPHAPVIWTSSATSERLGTLLSQEETGSIGWLSAEGGELFEIIGGRYSNGSASLDLFLKSWSGDPEAIHRIGRETVYLDRPLLTIGLSPQPELLHGLASRPGFRGRGLLDRFLILLPQSPLGCRTLEADPLPGHVEGAYMAGIRAMLGWPANPDGDRWTIHLEPDAYREWLAFAREIEATMAPGGDLETLTGVGGKLPGQAARLAGILHCIEHAPGRPWEAPVSKETTGRALELAAVMLRHTMQAHDLMGSDPSIAAASLVWSWIKRGLRETFTVRDAYQALKGTFPRVEQLREALAVLEERGLVRVREQNRTGPGRKPSPVVEVNPRAIGGAA